MLLKTRKGNKRCDDKVTRSSFFWFIVVVGFLYGYVVWFIIYIKIQMYQNTQTEQRLHKKQQVYSRYMEEKTKIEIILQY